MNTGAYYANGLPSLETLRAEGYRWQQKLDAFEAAIEAEERLYSLFGVDLREAEDRSYLLDEELRVFSFPATPQHLRDRVWGQVESGGDRLLTTNPRTPGIAAGQVILKYGGGARNATWERPDHETTLRLREKGLVWQPMEE